MATATLSIPITVTKPKEPEVISVTGGGSVYDPQGTMFTITLKRNTTVLASSKFDAPCEELLFDTNGNVYDNLYWYGTNHTSRTISGNIVIGYLSLGFTLAPNCKNTQLASITGNSGSSWYGSTQIVIRAN